MKRNILAINASPNKDGNVDRMINHLIAQSGCKYEKVRLSEKSISPCPGCAHLCSKDNICKINDDFKDILPKILDADILILGCPSYFNGLNSYMFVLLERLWCMRHQRYPLEGKPFFIVAVGGIQEPNGVVSGIRSRMEAYNASFAGAITYLSGNIPCFKCGFGRKCEVGAIRKIYTKDQMENININELTIHRWEESRSTQKQMQEAINRMQQCFYSPVHG